MWILLVLILLAISIHEAFVDYKADKKTALLIDGILIGIWVTGLLVETERYFR